MIGNLHLKPRWEIDMLREQAERHLEKWDDKQDRKSYRSEYYKNWMLKKYECSTIRELRSWVRFG